MAGDEVECICETGRISRFAIIPAVEAIVEVDYGEGVVVDEEGEFFVENVIGYGCRGGETGRVVFIL